jgi:tyrosine-protein kinase Etk/Wzc
MDNKKNSSLDQLADFIDFRKLVGVLSENIFSVIAIVVFFFSAWLAYLNYTSPAYMVRSLIQIDSRNVADTFSSTPAIFNIIDSNNLQEQSAIFKSRSNLLNLVRETKINYLIDDKNLDFEKKYYFDDLTIKPKNPTSNLEFTIEFDEDYYLVKGLSSDENQVYDYNKTIEHDEFFLEIERGQIDSYASDQKVISYINEDSLISKLDAEIVVGLAVTGAFSAKNTLLYVTYAHQNIGLAKKVVNKINEIFLNQSVVRNSEQASASLSFLESRKKEIQTLLKISEQKLNAFQEQNLVYEQGEEGRILLNESRNIDNQLNKLELNEIEIRANFSQSSDAIKNLSIQKNVLQQQKDDILETISNLPAIEQEYINLLRDVEINQNILENLLNKIIEFSIVEASTISDVRIIDDAYFYGQVAPRPLFSLGLSLVAMAIFIFGWIFVKYIFFRRIKKPSDIFDLVEPKNLLGTIARSDSSLLTEMSTRDKEAISTLTNNIIMANNDDSCTSLMITGATKGVGKTTTSHLVSESLRAQGKKVALIDCDFRQGDLHKIYNTQKIESYDAFKVIVDEYNYDKEQVFFIPRLSNSSSDSIAIFNSEIFRDLVKTLKLKFDFIVYDTPPVLSISDSLTLSQYADENIIVIKHDETWFNDLSTVLTNISAVNDNPIKIVYNFYSRRAFTYNYNYYDSYTYSYYSNTYDYEDKK